METTEYPIVSTEERQLTESTYWSNYANIIDLGFCKIVQLDIYRKSTMNIGTNWTEIITASNLPSDLLPNYSAFASDGRQQINFKFDRTNGIRGQAKTSGNYTFLVSFTYVVI